MSIFNFFKPFQYIEIGDGESGTVLLIKVPQGCRAYIQRTGNNWFPNTYFEWKVDGEIVEKVERMIAPTPAPKPESPPIIAVDKIEWIAYNNSNSIHTFAVLQDGIFQEERHNAL